MKVLCVIPSLGSGGAERQLVSLAVLFKQKGIDVEFLIYHKDFFYKYILDENSIKINLISTNNNFDRVLKVRKFIRDSKSDAVISFLETPSFLACISTVGGKKWKLITTELSSKKSTFESLKGKLFCYFRRYSDLIVCNSYNSMTMWENYHPDYFDKLKVIYNPVILPVITSTYVPKKNNRLNLLVAASYQYLKNPICLIEALSLLDEDIRKKVIVNWYGRKEITAGDTKAYDEAMSLIDKYNLHDVIKLNGPTTDIANKMNEADIVGLFSKLEGLPNAICEAMMIGKPIIMSKVSDYINLVDEENGFLCDWDNPNSIKIALEQAIFLNDKELIKMGLKSKIKADKLFSSEVIVNQWISFLS